MIEWIESLSAVEQTFLGMAVIGGTIYMIQLVIMLIGGVDTTDGVGIGDTFAGTDFVFKYFSIQGLTAFFMVGGIVGLYVCSKGAGVSVAVIAAIVSGFIMAYTLKRFTDMLLKLQSSGNIDLKNAIGVSCSVYQFIPHDGEGKVEINLQGRRLYVKAISSNHDELKTGVRAKVLSVSGGDTLVVTQDV